MNILRTYVSDFQVAAGQTLSFVIVLDGTAGKIPAGTEVVFSVGFYETWQNPNPVDFIEAVYPDAFVSSEDLTPEQFMQALVDDMKPKVAFYEYDNTAPTGLTPFAERISPTHYKFGLSCPVVRYNGSEIGDTLRGTVRDMIFGCINLFNPLHTNPLGDSLPPLGERVTPEELAKLVATGKVDEVTGLRI